MEDKTLLTTSLATSITKDELLKALDKLRPYKLYGTKENLDKVRDILPYSVEPIEFPDCFFNEDMMDKFILIDKTEPYYVSKVFESVPENFGSWEVNKC